MLILGVVVLLVGSVFLLDLGGAAEKFADWARSLPAWRTWPSGTSPMYYRFAGVVFIAAGASIIHTAVGR